MPVVKEVTYSPAKFREGVDRLLVTAIFAISDTNLSGELQSIQLERAASALEKSHLFNSTNKGEVFIENNKLILTLRYADIRGLGDFYSLCKKNADDIIEQAEAFIKAVVP